MLLQADLLPVLIADRNRLGSLILAPLFNRRQGLGSRLHWSHQTAQGRLTYLDAGERTQIKVAALLHVRPRGQRSHFAIADIQQPRLPQRLLDLLNGRHIQSIIRPLAADHRESQGQSQRVQGPTA